MSSSRLFWSFLLLVGFALQAEAKVIQIKIVTPSQSTAKGECSPIVRLQMMNEAGDVEKVGKAVTVELKSIAKDLKFFSDPKCEKKITSVNVLAGESSTVFYVRAAHAGAKSVVVSSPGYLGDIKSLTVQ